MWIFVNTFNVSRSFHHVELRRKTEIHGYEDSSGECTFIRFPINRNLTSVCLLFRKYTEVGKRRRGLILYLFGKRRKTAASIMVMGFAQNSSMNKCCMFMLFMFLVIVSYIYYQSLVMLVLTFLTDKIY